MIVQQSDAGQFLKGGVRYAITRPPGVQADPVSWARENGYAFTPSFRPPRPPGVTAQKWIESQGYSALMAVALMDLERKAEDAGVTSSKLNAVRSWFDAVLAAYAADPSPRIEWPPAPHSFAEVAADVATRIGT